MAVAVFIGQSSTEFRGAYGSFAQSGDSQSSHSRLADGALHRFNESLDHLAQNKVLPSHDLFFRISRDLLNVAHTDTTAESAYIGFALVLITFTLISLFYEER
jgi:hypothetical protein